MKEKIEGYCKEIHMAENTSKFEVQNLTLNYNDMT